MAGRRKKKKGSEREVVGEGGVERQLDRVASDV